jgi:valyl-tRNA synthetase
MEKRFSPRDVEARWRERWESLRIGHADVHSTRAPFVIALPPPNITGELHMGHACGSSIQDALSRHHRMLGEEVEWCPGTDHAAIATQNVIERQLAAEGTSKEQLGRERFQQRVDAWYEEYGGRIFEQMRRLGFTCDWARARFTLDDAYVRAIRVAFKALYDEGLIYRGPRMVNWCPHDRSAISDEEVDWQEHDDVLYHVRYAVEGGDYITIATVRPETILGDTGVAVARDDVRWARLVGRNAVIPLVNRSVQIFEDAAVRPEFGSGALKVTPGHDPTDYEVGQRHLLPTVTVIAPDGTMDVPTLPQFHGLPAEQARSAVVEALRALGAVVAEEPYRHSVGHCDRCGHVIEPLISEQWWVSMRSLAEPGIAVAEQGAITFHPSRYQEIYLTWMRNIRDWNISRQIWLGHAIPVSTCGNGHRFAWVEPPDRCPECGDTRLTHDPDVLDTWFSSALWPFAIFGWPDETEDLRRFYPTSVLVTDRGIIFLWVARMIMTGLKFMSTKPFGQVLITSTIQAADGSRMSKSKGNVIDPLDMVDRYGADAVRAWACSVGTGGQDVRFDEDRILGYQRFANKLWNVTRFLVGRLSEDGDMIASAPRLDEPALELEDRWMLAEVAQLVRDCDRALAAFRFHDAVGRLYDVSWHAYCDWYVEIVKRLRLGDAVTPRSRDAAVATALTALDVILRLLHPFMPFVTEECAQHLPGPAGTLQHRPWPQVGELSIAPDDLARSRVAEVIQVVQRIRALRQESGLPATAGDPWPVNVTLDAPEPSLTEVARLLAGLAPVEVVDGRTDGADGLTVQSGALRVAISVTAGAR